MKELHVVPHEENKGLPLFKKPNPCVLVRISSYCSLVNLLLNVFQRLSLVSLCTALQ